MVSATYGKVFYLNVGRRQDWHGIRHAIMNVLAIPGDLCCVLREQVAGKTVARLYAKTALLRIALVFLLRRKMKFLQLIHAFLIARADACTVVVLTTD